MTALLEVRDLVKHYPAEEGVLSSRAGRKVRAVDGVTFSVERSRTLGVVGESGSGKSTVARVIVGLLEPTSGDVRLDGVDVRALRGGRRKRYRRDVQMVFQNPYASLNPRMTVAEIVTEPLKVHRIGTRVEQLHRARQLLETVGLGPEHLGRYPHEFSGGQRQRIGIARAIALGPRLLVCDEPVSALDVSVRAQVLNLLRRLQEELGLAYLFIAHDLSVVRHISHEIVVMYLGRIVEQAAAEELCTRPSHPYTQALLSAELVPDPEMQRGHQRILLPGDPPSPIDPPAGCRFHPRCPIADLPLCATEEPTLRESASGHLAACHFARPFPISMSTTTTQSA